MMLKLAAGCAMGVVLSAAYWAASYLGDESPENKTAAGDSYVEVYARTGRQYGRLSTIVWAIATAAMLIGAVIVWAVG